MEPTKPEAKNDDLHSEGIDVVGSGVAFDNEFSTGATDERVIEPTVTAPATPPAPQPVQPVEKPIPQVPKEMPQMAQQQFVPKEQPKPTIQTNDPSIHQLRTFKTDAEEAIKYGGASKISIAVAEQEKKEKSGTIEYTEKKKSPWMLIFVLVCVVSIALAVGWYYWSQKTQNPLVQIDAPSPSIQTMLPYNKASSLILDPSFDPITLIESKMKTNHVGVGNIYAVIPVLSATSSSQAPIINVLDQTKIPDRLSRSLGTRYMFGTYAYESEAPFMILTDTFYQNAFAGMLDWEKDLFSDFKNFITHAHPDTDLSSINTENFEDSVVANIDVRAIRDSSGTILLAYAFADKDTIIITTSESALKYLLNRLLQVRTIQ